MDFSPRRIVTAPKDIALLHYAYSRPDERKKKHIAYMQQAQQLTQQEIAHANSIIDIGPRVLPLAPPIDYEVRYGR